MNNKAVTNQGAFPMQQLASLENGWFNGEGTAIHRDTLVMAHEAYDTILDRSHVNEIFVYPMPDGGIQLEWQEGTEDWSMEVHPDYSVELHVSDISRDMNMLCVFRDVYEALSSEVLS